MKHIRFWLTTPFWIIGLGLFLSAYAYGVSTAAFQWVPDHHPYVTQFVSFCWPPLWLIVGILAGSVAADALGRRFLLMRSPVFYVIGGIGILIDHQVAAALLGTAFLMLAAGMESISLLTWAQESVPTRVRKQAMYLELNFINLGGLVMAAPAYLGGLWDADNLRGGRMIIPLLVLIVSYLLRVRSKESRVWRRAKARGWKSLVTGHYLFRFFVSSAFSFSNVTGFALLGYAYGAQLFLRHFNTLFFVSSLSAAGIVLASRFLATLPPKRLLLLSYGLAFGSSFTLYFVPKPHEWPFWLVLLLLSTASSVSYLAEDTFKTSHWPTRYRARLTGAIRVTGLVAYALVLGFLYRQSTRFFLIGTILAWLVGLVAAIVWFIGTHRRHKRPKSIVREDMV